jgi:alcohol dehydrogenase class IV
MVHEAAALSRREGCDVVLGLGGGSSIDASKSTAFMAVNDGDVSEYIYGKPGAGALPIVILSTTAATGSEVNPFAVLTNPDTLDKKGLRNEQLYRRRR